MQEVARQVFRFSGQQLATTIRMGLLRIEPAPAPYRFRAVFGPTEGPFANHTGSIFFGTQGEKCYIDGANREDFKMDYKEIYDIRMRKPISAAYLKSFILWGESRDIDENIKTYKKLFGL